MGVSDNKLDQFLPVLVKQSTRNRRKPRPHGFRLKKWVFLDEIAAKPVLSTTCESFLATLVLMRSAGDDRGYKLLLVKDFKQCTGNV